MTTWKKDEHKEEPEAQQTVLKVTQPARAWSCPLHLNCLLLSQTQGARALVLRKAQCWEGGPAASVKLCIVSTPSLVPSTTALPESPNHPCTRAIPVSQ